MARLTPNLVHGKAATFVQLTAIAIAALLYGCEGEQESTQTAAHGVGPSAVLVQLSEAQKQKLSENTRAAWQLAEPAISHTTDNARQLQSAVDKLLSEPSAASLTQAQEQWRKTALAYQPLRLYMTLAELTPEHLGGLRRLGFSIAAQPIQPGYLDSVGPYAWSGLVHDIGLPLTPEILREQHGMTSPEDASLGLFAMEFLLFGIIGEQPRQATDYEARQQLSAEDREQGFTKPDELPENRRRRLLLLQSRVLVEDLQRLHSLWQPDTENSFYPIYMSYSGLQRRALLLQSLRLELTELLVQLTPPAEVGGVATGEEVEEAAEDPANMLFADTAPTDFLVARLQSMNELLRTLEASEALQQSLEQALSQMQQQEADATTTAAEAISKSLELLAAEQHAYRGSSPKQPAIP